jgi:S1-C subfamily serine protease
MMIRVHSVARLAVLGVVTTLATGCGGAVSSSAPLHGDSHAQAGDQGANGTDTATCNALGSLVDLRRAMTSAPTSPSSPVYALVDAEEELGYARVALDELGRESASRQAVSELVTILDSRIRELRRATENARASYASAEQSLHSAYTCRGVYLGDLARQPDGREKKSDVAIAHSKPCEGTLRLWAATKGTVLSSETSTSGSAAQIGELRLAKSDALLRDRLATALRAHAKHLTELRELGGSAEPTSDQRALLAVRSKVGELVDDAFRGCLTSEVRSLAARSAPRSTALAADPRSATVMVRPTWSGSLAALGAGERRFGSGFLVRWTRRDGRTETLVVTNRHVMEGAARASISLSSEIDAHDTRDHQSPRTARIVAADESDDIAILRIDAASTTDLDGAALTFRTELPREQEVVVAAGFPGIGATPSFQVTKGVVSNAHFGSDESEVGIAYVQHTAAIDPGNSGGPLLDDAGRLLGMNTAKLRGRDNVSLAIPSARIRFSLRRAEERQNLTEAHAEASCNVALEALAADHPSMTSISRFGLPLFERAEKQAEGRKETNRHRDRVVGAMAGPVDEARLRAYELAREEVETSGGVLPFEACTDVARLVSPPDGPASFTARFRGRSGVAYRVVLTEEDGVVRVSSLDRATAK